jgi:hypothetical protein
MLVTYTCFNTWWPTCCALQGMLEIISAASEYDGLPVRPGEEETVGGGPGSQAWGRGGMRYRCCLHQRAVPQHHPVVQEYVVMHCIICRFQCLPLPIALLYLDGGCLPVCSS